MIEYGEYDGLMTILKASDDQEDTYQQLMAKEASVLSTIDNVVNFNREVQVEDSMFLNHSLAQLFNDYITTWSDVLREALACRSYGCLLGVLVRGDRIIHMGLSLILLSLVLFFVRISC